MATRTAITQVAQLGVESTPGTAVAAGKRLQSVNFELAANPEVSTFRPAGFKFATVSAMNKEWTTGSISGQPTYDEMIYLYSSCFAPGVVVAGTGAETGAYTWTFAPSTTATDALKTYTIEQGSALRAHKVAHAIFPGLSISYNNGRSSIELGGDILAGKVTDAISLTGSPASIPLVPILPSQTTFYYDTTAAGLGTTKLTDVVGGSFTVSDRVAPKWVYDASIDSFKEVMEVEPTVEVKLVVESNAQGMGLLTDLRTSASRFIRIASAGGSIAGSAIYSHRLNACVKWTNAGGWTNEDGIFAIEFTGTVHHDATWGSAFSADVVNTSSAL